MGDVPRILAALVGMGELRSSSERRDLLVLGRSNVGFGFGDVMERLVRVSYMSWMPSERPCWRLERLLCEDLDEDGLCSGPSMELRCRWSAFLARDLREFRNPEWMLLPSEDEEEKRLNSPAVRSDLLILRGGGQRGLSTTFVILAVIAEGDDCA